MKANMSYNLKGNEEPGVCKNGATVQLQVLSGDSVKNTMAQGLESVQATHT